MKLPTMAISRPISKDRLIDSPRSNGKRGNHQRGGLNEHHRACYTRVLQRGNSGPYMNRQKQPASKERRRSLRGSVRSSSLCRNRRKGESSNAATASRYADMTSDVASDCANRMKMDESEAASTASASTAPTGGCDSAFRMANVTFVEGCLSLRCLALR